MAIGLNIKHLRKIYGWTTQELGDRAELHNGTISRYESEKTIPGGDASAKLAAIFGIPVEVLLREDVAQKWASLNELEQWREREATAKSLASEHMDEMNVAHYKLEAFIDVVCKYLGGLTGKSPESIRAEIEALFEARVAAMQERFRGTSFDLTDEVLPSSHPS